MAAVSVLNTDLFLDAVFIQHSAQGRGGGFQKVNTTRLSCLVSRLTHPGHVLLEEDFKEPFNDKIGHRDSWFPAHEKERIEFKRHTHQEGRPELRNEKNVQGSIYEAS